MKLHHHFQSIDRMHNECAGDTLIIEMRTFSRKTKKCQLTSEKPSDKIFHFDDLSLFSGALHSVMTTFL